MPTIMAVTQNTTVQNAVTVDEQYAGGVLVAIRQEAPVYNYTDPGDNGAIGNAASNNSSSVVKFAGLSNLPVGSDVLSAKLYVYTGGGFGSIISDAYPLLRNSVYNQVTWNVWSTGNNWTTPGARGAGDVGTPSGITETITSGGVWYEFDVTDHVQAIADETADDYGWLLSAVTQDADTGFRFLIRDIGTDGNRPELIVEYNLVPLPDITGITGTWRPGNSLTITTDNLGTITSATLGGEALTITGTASNQVTVTVPTDIALEWGASYTLTVGDGTDTASEVGLTLLARTGWSYINFVGPVPDPLTTEGFYEYADVYRSFEAAVGDQLQYTDSAGLTVDDQWIPNVSPAATVTGTYAIFDVSTGTRLDEDPYTIRDSELIAGDSYYDRLGSLGHTGSLSVREFNYLGDLGFTGAMSTRKMAHLKDLGYTGNTISELLKQKADAEGYDSVSAMMKNTGLIPQ